MTSRKDILARKKRLKACFDFLKKQKRVATYSDLALATGIPASSIRVAFSRASDYISEGFLDNFCAAFPRTFSREWIAEGEGEMLLPGAEELRMAYPQRWQRVAHIMAREGLTYTSMSRLIGYPNNATLYRIVCRHLRPQDETLEKILRAFPQYDREWLFTGHGTALPQEVEVSVEKSDRDTVEYYVPFKQESFALISDPAAAGTLTNYSDYDPDEDERRLKVPVDRDYRGKYALFTVKGASMDDGSPLSLSDGDVVLARMIPRQYWEYKLHKNAWRYFIFVTRTEGIIVKSIAEHDTERGILYLHSLNPDYPDLTIRMEDIQAIYNVIELTRRSLRW